MQVAEAPISGEVVLPGTTVGRSWRSPCGLRAGRIQERRRVKTDALDLEAITELVLNGRGIPVTSRGAVTGELRSWAAHRDRRVLTRTATKNQPQGQPDRAFPGLTHQQARQRGRCAGPWRLWAWGCGSTTRPAGRMWQRSKWEGNVAANEVVATFQGEGRRWRSRRKWPP